MRTTYFHLSPEIFSRKIKKLWLPLLDKKHHCWKNTKFNSTEKIPHTYYQQRLKDNPNVLAELNRIEEVLNTLFEFLGWCLDYGLCFLEELCSCSLEEKSNIWPLPSVEQFSSQVLIQSISTLLFLNSVCLIYSWFLCGIFMIDAANQNFKIKLIFLS